MSTETISQKQYDALLQEGYQVHAEQTIKFRASIGKNVVLHQPLDTCERMGKIFSCCLIAPFACLCAPIFKEAAWGCCESNCYQPGLGFIEKVYFIIDPKKTAELKQQDYELLGCASEGKLDNKKLANYVQQQITNGGRKLHSSKLSEHSYMTLYGPASQFSYVIIVPFGNLHDTDNISLFAVYHTNDGKPLNSGELMQKADQACAAYRPNVNNMRVTTETVPIAYATHDAVYGTVKSIAYENREKVIYG